MPHLLYPYNATVGKDGQLTASQSQPNAHTHTHTTLFQTPDPAQAGHARINLLVDFQFHHFLAQS